VFHALEAPTAGDVTEVARRTAERTKKILEKHGRTLEPGGDAGGDDDTLVADQPVLAACYAAAAQGLSLTGEREGQPVLRLVDPLCLREAEPVAEVMGFNVHARVAVGARDRARLERLCRYLCRPPIAQERLEEHPSGKLRYSLKKPWSDGTVAMMFEPQDLVARICALIPPPRFHMVRYHGLLSSHASRRKEVVPKPDEREHDGKQLGLFPDASAGSDELPRRKPWAWLLRHVFQVDVTSCPACGGTMRLLETATTPDAIAALLARQGLAPRPPPREPCPSPPGQLMLAFMKKT
jgi:hypothetical protein